ncbi:hypothetical protein [Roseobacter ponti]|uniref:IrrE N-terminal-like domain-containing protein n=1 Tax=Roseobacter ponti TaxID=1891787 RepID=A0A858SN39_9RHOB|nr:hypothetical protein [Roseobacter ponti]QJF50095.1 hypothetical protein G3256_02380 [Roseobacter ponti]
MTKYAIPPVDRLLRGISTNHVETVRSAWGELLSARAPATGQVIAKLASEVWEQPPRGPSGPYFGVLLALLDTLDPEAFESVVGTLRKRRLNPLHRRTLEVVAQRVGETPACHIGDGVPVYISKDIAAPAMVQTNLSRWSRTRGLALDGITRIDVIGRAAHLDYLGRYNMFFSGIVLTWPVRPQRGLRLWFEKLSAEFTFYHEIGHHVCGHSEGGQVAEQEKEADDYARRMMRRARPVLTSAGRLLLWPLTPAIRRLKAAHHPSERAG